MSSVTGIIGRKVQNLTLRVGAFHAAPSDEVRKCVLSARLSDTPKSETPTITVKIEESRI